MKNELARQALAGKQRAHNAYAPLSHEIGREILPKLVAQDKKNRDAIVLYVYLLSHVNGQPDSDRYMSAWPTLETIAKETGIDRNRISKLAGLLEQNGLIRSVYEYSRNKREKLYYPMYAPLQTEEGHNVLDWL